MNTESIDMSKLSTPHRFYGLRQMPAHHTFVRIFATLVLLSLSVHILFDCINEFPGGIAASGAGAVASSELAICTSMHGCMGIAHNISFSPIPIPNSILCDAFLTAKSPFLAPLLNPPIFI